MRYLHDLPLLKRHFAELGERGWRDVISGKRGKHAALAAEAWPLYVEEYGLAEHQPTVPGDAAREYMAALKAGELPRWVQDMALTKEIKRAARKGGEQQT